MLPLVVVQPLLHIPRQVAVALNQPDRELVRGHRAVFLRKRFPYPGVHREDIRPSEPEQQHAVRHLAPHPVQRGELCAELLRRERAPLCEVLLREPLSRPREIFRPVARTHGSKELRARARERLDRREGAVAAHVLSERVADAFDYALDPRDVIVLRNQEGKDGFRGVLPEDVDASAEGYSRRNKPFILRFQLYYIIIRVKIKIFFEKRRVVAFHLPSVRAGGESRPVPARDERRPAAREFVAEHLSRVQRGGKVEGGRLLNEKLHKNKKAEIALGFGVQSA